MKKFNYTPYELGCEVIGTFKSNGDFDGFTWNGDRPELPLFIQREAFIEIVGTKIYLKGIYSDIFTSARMIAMGKNKDTTIDEHGKIKYVS